MCRVRPTQTPMIKEKQREIPPLSTIPPAILQEQFMFDLNSLLTAREKIYMQDSELGSQVPLISSDGPDTEFCPWNMEWGDGRLSASICNPGSEYSSLWFSFYPLLSFLLFLSEPDILKGLGFCSVLFCFYFLNNTKITMCQSGVRIVYVHMCECVWVLRHSWVVMACQDTHTHTHTHILVNPSTWHS